MNKRKVIMMLSLLIITILTASGFYILTGEAKLSNKITVNSIRIKDGDYEKIYGEGPYKDAKGRSYYIRYTGAESGRKTLDLDIAGYGLTKSGEDVVIMDTTITSTYKMFSKRNDDDVINTEITRVFIPSSIAINYDEKSDGTYNSDLGIASNTFAGYESSTIEKDVIYHTGNVLTNDSNKDAKGEGVDESLDRTSKISKSTYAHVTTYVYLGSENVLRGSNVETLNLGNYQYQYLGRVKNVFISNSVDYPSAFFAIAYDNGGQGTMIDYALLDSGEDWYSKNMGLSSMFYDQSNLNITSNFKLPEHMYQGDNSVSYNNFGCRNMFFGTAIGELPANFKIPDEITNVAGMFYNCVNLKGVITLSKNANIFNQVGEPIFKNAGTSASNYKQCNTPIIVKYSVTNSSADNYVYNVYTPQNPDGKVTMIPLTGSTSNWEKVYETGAPYNDEDGAYYVRYKGSNTTLDIGTETNDIKLSAGTKHSCVADTKLRSTYKMFSKRSGNNAVNTEITRVYIPSNIAIEGDSSTGVQQSDGTYKFDENKGIASNTFAGYESSTVEKDVIYHTGNVLTDDSDKDAKGEGIGESLDRTSKISESTYAHVTTYVYLGNENVSRDSDTEVYSAGTYNYQYSGSVKNVFISNSVDYPSGFFSLGDYSTGHGTLIDYALLDSGEEWYSKNMGLGFIFYKQSNLNITSNFKLPEHMYQGDNSVSYGNYGCRAMFLSTAIGELPSNFKIPDEITNVAGMFYNCVNLKGVVTLSENANIFKEANEPVFKDAGKSASNLNGYNTPVVARVYKDSPADTYFKNNAFDTVTVEVINATFSQSSNSANAIATVRESIDRIVIEDCTDVISVTVNKINNQESISIEDETECVTVIVNKHSDEEDEVQE